MSNRVVRAVRWAAAVLVLSAGTASAQETTEGPGHRQGFWATFGGGLAVARNACSSTTKANNYSFPAGQFNGPIACQIYQGCDKIPVEWCQHRVVGFDGNSTHGWPGSAGKVVWDFWKSLP